LNFKRLLSYDKDREGNDAEIASIIIFIIQTH